MTILMYLISEKHNQNKFLLTTIGLICDIVTIYGFFDFMNYMVEYYNI